jgi:hypothetical protein
MLLACNDCINNSEEFCLKLKVSLRNGYAKLFFGGVQGCGVSVAVCQKK